MINDVRVLQTNQKKRENNNNNRSYLLSENTKEKKKEKVELFDFFYYSTSINDRRYICGINSFMIMVHIYTFEYLLNFYISQCISLYIQTEAEKMLTCFYFSLNHTYIDMLNKCHILLDNLYNDEYLITAVQKIYTYFNCDISSSQLNFDDTSYLLSIVDVRFKCHLEVELLKDETFLLIFLSMPCVHMFDFSSFCSFFFFKSN
jgi:hypothetical protein